MTPLILRSTKYKITSYAVLKSSFTETKSVHTVLVAKWNGKEEKKSPVPNKA